MKISKVLCFMLAALCLLLCACGSSAGSTPAPEPAATAAPAPEAAEEAAAEVDEALEEAEAAAAEAVEEAVEEAAEVPPATEEYDIAIEKMKTLFDGELVDFAVGEDYVITVPGKWWAIEGDVMAEFDLDHTYAAITTITVPGFPGYTIGDIIENDEYRESLLGGIVGELEDAEVEEYKDITINGVRLLTQKAKYLIDGEHWTANFVLTIDDAGNLNSLTFVQSERAKSDYTERFDTILNTLRLKPAEEEGPPMADIKGAILYMGRFTNAADGTAKRLAYLMENEFLIDYALPYYKENFRSDREEHYITNFDITASIKKTDEGLLVNIYEYADGEESDENLAGTGKLLSSYIVNIETGEAKQLS